MAQTEKDLGLVSGTMLLTAKTVPDSDGMTYMIQMKNIDLPTGGGV